MTRVKRLGSATLYIWQNDQMEILSQKTLAQIVTEDHRTAAVFEKYNLDFCCKGKRPLDQACTEQKVDVNMVLSDITSVIGSTPLNKAAFSMYTPTQLVDYILNTHHAYSKRELPLILQYLQKVASKHGGRHPELLQIFDLFGELKSEMETHMEKEEVEIFPRVKKLGYGNSNGDQEDRVLIKEMISMMESEHDHAGNLVAQIKKLTNNYQPPEDACTTYWLSFVSLDAFERDLHHHVHLENNILVPKVLAILDTPAACSCDRLANRNKD